MCRIFAVRATTPISVRPAFDGLQKLAAEHKDGWGVAHFPQSGKWVETGTLSAESCSRFDELGDLTTQAMLVHIRLASVGTVHERNTHPFSAGPWVFMHNGTLKHFATARARFEAQIAPPFRAELRGETDSECCFALFRTYLDQQGLKLPPGHRASAAKRREERLTITSSAHTKSRLCANQVGFAASSSAMRAARPTQQVRVNAVKSTPRHSALLITASATPQACAGTPTGAGHKSDWPVKSHAVTSTCTTRRCEVCTRSPWASSLNAPTARSAAPRHRCVSAARPSPDRTSAPRTPQSRL